MSNKNASDGAGSSKHAQQPPQQQTEGEDMELIEEDNEVTSMASDDVEDTDISLSEMRSALPTFETSSPPAAETSSLTMNLREQIKQTLKTQKPIVKKLQKEDFEGGLELPREDFDAVLNSEEKLKLKLLHDRVDVDVYDEQLTKYPMIAQYVIPFKFYVLTGGVWDRFSMESGLKPYEDTLTLWAFHHYRTGKLSFYIKVSKTRKPEALKTQVPASTPEGGPSNVL